MITALHPIHANEDGIFNTATGHQINILNPNPESISIEDIARGLSNIVRFGGQITEPYTVAQHSILVMRLAPEELKFAALMHDAPEAYIGDVIKPLKVLLGESYGFIEANFERAIFRKFFVNVQDVRMVKPFDMLALEIENNMRYGLTPLDASDYFHRHFPEGVWSHRTAYNEFKNCFDKYSKEG